MNNSDLATYLNDHLAGSVAGLAMLEQIIRRMEGHGARADLERIKAEIEEEQQSLQRLIDGMGATESSIRKVAAWLGEKFAELKLRFDDPDAGPFLLFESLEAMSLGIEGKRSLWKALAAAAPYVEPIRELDLAQLERQAADQRAVVEALRPGAAPDALAP